MDTSIISAGVPPVFGNINHNSQALSRQSNVPSHFSTRTTNHPSTSSIPATAMPPTPSTHAADFQPVVNQPNAWTTSFQPYMYQPHGQMGHQPFQNPLTQEQLSLLQKGPNYAITPKYPPIGAYITSTELAANQTTIPGSR